MLKDAVRVTLVADIRINITQCKDNGFHGLYETV